MHILHLLLVLLLCTPVPALCATVVSVHDGDSFQARTDPGTAPVAVRLYGVDCPELGQPYGRETRDTTRRLVENREIRIIPAQKAASYRRTVAVVVVPDDLLVLQDVLVSAGLAWVDDRYCKRPVCELWRLHQQEARAARRGLWADPNPVPPWAWRRMKRK